MQNSVAAPTPPPDPSDRMEAPEDENLTEPSFFAEAARCDDLLRRLDEVLSKLLDESPCGGEVGNLVAQFAAALVPYQENPCLLYPYLEAMISPLVRLLTRYLPPANTSWDLLDRLEAANSDASPPDEGVFRPKALGQNLDMFDMDAPKTPLHWVCRALYVLVKTAGEKSCTSHFPSEVGYYEDVFYALQLWKADPCRLHEWEVRYCLLLWLSNLILVPFELSSIDSKELLFKGGKPRGHQNTPAGGSLSDAVLTIAVSFLSDSSRCREGAALVVARLLTRPDSSRHRRIFFSYAHAILMGHSTLLGPLSSPLRGVSEEGEVPFVNALLGGPAPSDVSQGSFREDIAKDHFLRPGVLLAVAKTLKLGQRLEMLPYASELLRGVVQLLEHQNRDCLLRKTAVKVCQRLCLCMLRSRRASWRYHRSDVLSLETNLGERIPEKAPTANGAGGDDDEEEASIEGDPIALEEGINLLLDALGHPDTVVRWSAAKGVGRVCERLPAESSQKVLQSLYLTFSHAHNDAHWHGGLLALSELCRRGVVGAGSLSHVVGFVSRGLLFDVSKGTYSLGAHVRDAACYTCWSIARAYDAWDIEPHVRVLSTRLVATALFDREVSVRRAAAGAFQECVGRLGNFPDGIDLVTAMDFFSLATIKNAYLTVAPKIAAYDAYRGTMLEVLMGEKVNHWDRAVRQCAAAALGRIAPLEAQSTIKKIFTELQGRVLHSMPEARHGAVLALTELVLRVPEDIWSDTHREQLVEVLVRLDAAGYFHSHDGDYLRQAVCGLLSACAERRLSLPEFVSVIKLSGERRKARTLAKVQEFLEETWRSILGWVQKSGADAFRVVAHAYYTEFQPQFHGKVLEKMLEACSMGEKSLLGRRGFLAAIGGLPSCMLTAVRPQSASSFQEAPYYMSVLQVLCQAAQRDEAEINDPELGDVEARRNAVQSLGKVMLTLQRDVDIGFTCYRAVVEVFLEALCDYTIDKRGDVGSFVRLESLNALPAVVFHGLSRVSPKSSQSAAQPWCDTSLAVRVVQNILRVMMEPLDRVRTAALAALVRLLGSPEDTTQIDLICAIYPKDGSVDEAVVSETSTLRELVISASCADFSSPREILTHFGPKLLRTCPRVYAQSVMEGLVLSAGDLTDHINRTGFEILLDSFSVSSDGTQEDPRLRLSESLVGVVTKHIHVERVLVPFAHVLERLLNAGVFSETQHHAVVGVLRQEFNYFKTTITVLLGLVSLLGSMCRSADSVARHDAWLLALIVIASRYPKVRSKMATNLYTALLVWTSTVKPSSEADANAGSIKEHNGCTRAMEHLLSVQWDGKDVNKVRQARNELYEMLGISPPAVSSTLKDELKARPVHREIVAGTYSDLVHEAGY